MFRTCIEELESNSVEGILSEVDVLQKLSRNLGMIEYMCLKHFSIIFILMF